MKIEKIYENDSSCQFRTLSRQRCTLIISTGLYFCENFTLNVDFKNHSNLLKKIILKKLQCFNCTFALSIAERILFTICFISALT